MAKDLYEILGIARNSSEEEIKRAYRKLAQKYHPDSNKGDKSTEAKFKEINAAYEVLSDKKKRQTYDQFGQAGFEPGREGFAGGFDFGGFPGFGESFADIFETFFTSGSPHSREHRQTAAGENREMNLSISFEEGAFGIEKEVKITRISECQICHGKGAAPGSKLNVCQTCHGTGETRNVRSTILGQMTTRRVCAACSGEGRLPEKICPSCHGAGRQRVSEKLRVKIPAGIHDGSVVRIQGKGDSGLRGGETGDLYVHIQIGHHKLFERKDADVYSNCEIKIPQAVLGDLIEISTIHGLVKMKIPMGTPHGKVFRLKGYGVQKLRGQGKGDHFITILIKIPEKLSKREQELYGELAKAGGIELKEEKGFLKKMMGV